MSEPPSYKRRGITLFGSLLLIGLGITGMTMDDDSTTEFVIGFILFSVGIMLGMTFFAKRQEIVVDIVPVTQNITPYDPKSDSPPRLFQAVKKLCPFMMISLMRPSSNLSPTALHLLSSRLCSYIITKKVNVRHPPKCTVNCAVCQHPKVKPGSN
ncbi:uncharacterized protein LOC136034868 [Artemia franciscana]|uniref:uncharacterized protein LOC136034868 n=1 Tax=Artemia franciscana TaxID=6661 RepID=UPI0032DAFE6E